MITTFMASVIKLISARIPFKTAITNAITARILPIIPAAAFIAIGINLTSFQTPELTTGQPIFLLND